MNEKILIDDQIIELIEICIFLIVGVFFLFLELLIRQLEGFKNMDRQSVSLLYRAIRKQSILKNRKLKTMNEEQKKVLKIVKLLKKYPSTTIYDILYQTEVLVNSLDPLDHKSCKAKLFSLQHPEAKEMENGQFLVPNGLVFGLHFYTLYNPNTFIAIGTTYYYKTRLDLRPQKLTRTNLLASAKDTKLETPIQEYLFNHRLLKRDPKTKELMLITFLKERLKGSKAPYLL